MAHYRLPIQASVHHTAPPAAPAPRLASGTIASEEIRAAACGLLRGWHLNGARRVLADLDTPPSLAAAIRLDAWLRSEAHANGTDRVPTKRI